MARPVIELSVRYSESKLWHSLPQARFCSTLLPYYSFGQCCQIWHMRILNHLFWHSIHALFCFALLGPVGMVLAEAPLRIAPMPMESRAVTAQAFNPLVSYLERQLGYPVELVYFDSNDQIVKAMQDKKLDIGVMGALPFFSLKKRGGNVEPIAFFREANGDARYRCVLVRANSDAISPKKLRGKRIALTQPLSTCGYLGSSAILRRYAGITLEDMQYRYLKTHEAAALAVVSGDADIAGIKDEFAAKYSSLGLVVIAQSDPVPALSLIANRDTLNEQQISAIRKVLLATPESIYRHWGHTMAHGMVPANDVDFDAFRRFGNPDAIPEYGRGK